MLTKTDARGVTVSYSYDVLNRVTSINYPATTGSTGNSPAQTVSYVYDSCGNGKGRLCSFTDRTGNPQANLDLARNRAVAVRDALTAAGVPAARIDMRKPEFVIGGADASSRRVDLVAAR
jgi:YD repeat-containing protein